MNILFLTTILARKKQLGGEISTQAFIDGLTKNGHQVSVLGYSRKDDLYFKKSHQEIVIGQRYIESKRTKFYSLIWLMVSLIKNLPYSAGKYYSIEYINTVKEKLSHENYDVIIIDHSRLGWLNYFIEAKYKTALIAHNIEHEIYLESSNTAQNLISKWLYRREARLVKEMEDRLAASLNEVWAYTPHDAKYFSSLDNVGKVRVFGIPPSLNKLQPISSISKQFDIGIIGSWSWRANEEGLQWFLQSVYPNLPSSLSIHIAGKGGDWLIQKYGNIHYRGYVPDAQEFMAQAKVMAIPILSGSGIQIKTLDAIASGSSIVATPIALRGISDSPPTVKIAENPEDFANFLVSAVNSPAKRQASEEALSWVQTRQDNFIADVARAISEM
jgi:hypothetical protein